MKATVSKVVLFLLLLECAVASPVPGKWEKVQRLQPGVMIVVEMSHGDRFEGAFRKLTPTSLQIESLTGQIHEFPRDSIRSISAKNDAKEGFWTPTKVGALVGLGIGAAIGFAAGDDGVFDDFTGGFSAAVLGGIGAAGGALAGYAVQKNRGREEVLYVSA